MKSNLKCPNCRYVIKKKENIFTEIDGIHLFKETPDNIENFQELGHQYADGIYCPGCGDWVYLFELVVV